MNATLDFVRHLRESCAADTFVRLSLTSPRDPDAAVQRVLARLVDVRETRHLSLTFREARRDTVRNELLVPAIVEIERLLKRGEFRAAMLATTAADWQLQLDASGGAKLIRHRAKETTAPPRSHDEKKPTLLGEAALPWLEALGITDKLGRPKRQLADKHAQIDRYVEILAHLARDCGWGGDAAAPTPTSAPLRFVDVGCGKGHLTFAAWHLAKNVLHRAAEVIGVEVRQDLVDAANATARELGASDVRFVAGSIETAPLPGVDALIALHACNTATDHAIRRGVEANARLVVVAPCCHQEVRPQLGKPAPLEPVLKHGLMAERMAEWATDGLRSLVLEHCGYRTKVVEFVGSEHTPKNVMIAAVRAAEPPSAARRAETAAAIDAFRTFFGITKHALDPLLRGEVRA